MIKELERDLSLHVGLISDMFPHLSARDAWEEYKLSDEQIAHFHEYGYLSNVKILEENQVDQLNEELAMLADPSYEKNDLFYEFHSNQSEDPDTVLFHSLGHWRMTEGFHDILWNPRYVVAACQLLGNKTVRFWHDQLFCKPAKHGGVVAWHQDYSYWIRTAPMQHLTCWVGLDDSNTDNGCLHYIPKSHKWPLLERIGLAGDMDSLNELLTEQQQKEYANKVAIEMPKGHGSFHHPLMVHGSYENKSDRPRRAFVINVFADGTVSDTNDKLLNGVPAVKKGDKIEGQFFPLLFDPSEI